MRKGYDSLCGLVLQHFNTTVLSGDVFIFMSRQRNRIKLLHWQGDAFAIFQKRLERGTYEIPKHYGDAKSIILTLQQLQFILEGIILSCIRKRKRFEHPNVYKG
ncbi:MAG: IS66 family insertion sequence element accessory protein TnpB [Bacteroidetes bacterium]|nr:IS66 family insertion sequence element accessory protein TnpB [Bacteroidota bacterium]